MDYTTNPNTYWAYTLIDELEKLGLRAVCIAPGSRSTPLAFAFAESAIPIYIHPDERGTAFLALGLALASKQPTAILCTSGTAAANFFPAIVEAHQAHIPLLVLTADRNHELRDSGANQTIDQIKLYGGFVRWSIEVAPPSAHPSSTTLQYLRSLAARAFSTALGTPPGPVHLNLPFSKPLEPVALPGEASNRKALLPTRSTNRPFVTITNGQLTPAIEQINNLTQTIQHSCTGIIYCGPRCPGENFPAAVLHLAQTTGFPIFADALSGIRFHPILGHYPNYSLGGYETFLPSLRQAAANTGSELIPDLILQFGAVPTSKALADWFESLRSVRRVQINRHGCWSDDSYKTSDLLWVDEATLCNSVNHILQTNHHQPLSLGWREQFLKAEELTWQTIDQFRQESFFEGGIVADLLNEMAPNDGLFVASSLPVRHLDQFARPRDTQVSVFANRGASGIDGVIASAIGAAASQTCPRMVLLIGDLAFLHDLNSLLALRQYPQRLVIVLINNNGGGIFQRLPVANIETNPQRPLFTNLFLTPHGLHFEHAARLFDVSYAYITERNAFRNTLRLALQNISPSTASIPKTTILEIAGDSLYHERVRAAISERFTTLWRNVK